MRRAEALLIRLDAYIRLHHGRAEDIIEAEKNLDIEELVEAGVAGTEDIVIDPF